jgi:RNA polymerase sigma factor for flagellar operon FliA
MMSAGASHTVRDVLEEPRARKSHLKQEGESRGQNGEGTGVGGLRGEESVRLWERYARGGAGDESENELVKQYVPLVKGAVGRILMHLPPHVDEQALYSAGLVGLLEAVRHYDGKRSFEAYARIRIRGAMLDELRRMDWAPRSVHGKARRVQEAMADLEQRLGRAPEDVEVAAALGLGLAEYEELLTEIRPATFICLDACSEGDEGSGNVHEVMGDGKVSGADETVSRGELAALIGEGMERLPDFYRKVLALYYYEGLRVHEIAAATGYSRAHVCQTHAKAILMIRGYVERYERRGSRMQNVECKRHKAGEGMATRSNAALGGEKGEMERA